MLDVDPDWLVQGTLEPAIGVGFPIIDPHHHLWETGPRLRYGLAELRNDTASGWDVEATVYVDCMSGYRTDGPEHLRLVGETEYASANAAASNDGKGARIGAIVSRADLTRTDVLAEVLEGHVAAGNGLFRGIRHATAWDEDESIRRNHARAGKGAMLAPEFAEGARILGRMGLTFDAWLYHPQIGELVALAKAAPDTVMILDHIGAPLAIGRHAGHADEVLAEWRASVDALAACENVVVKLGGIGMADYGGDWRSQPAPPSSMTLADRWRSQFLHLIEAFGANRCMFESNFPVDKASCSYVTLWNTFARIAEGASDAERRSLFHDTAARVYRIA
jgi:L-fuconolactonase